MVSRVEQAKREDVAVTAHAPHVPHATPAPVASAPAIPKPANDVSGAMDGVDPMDFVRDNRIHIKNGSLFLDPYLVIHPRELKPENEARLREKLRLTYSVNNPSFYESAEREAIAVNLALLLPVSLEAEHAKELNNIAKVNARVDSGVDAELARQLDDRTHPFASIVRDTMTKQSRDPVAMETLTSGMAMYLLVREKLTRQGFLNPLTSYVAQAKSPDQVLGELAPKIGASPLQLREAALKHGLEGVGQVLGLDPADVADVKAFAAHAANHDFSLNLVEQWHLGRQLLRAKPSTLNDKIETGLAARIDKTMADAKAQLRNRLDVPEPIKAEEKTIAETLSLVDPIQRAVMFKLGYELCYTPDMTADSIAKYPGIYGLHRKAANDLNDVPGTYRIYFSGRGDLKGSLRTRVHEIAHNLWPALFSADDIKKIDSLAQSDAAHFAKWQGVVGEPDHFAKFEAFYNEYKAASDAHKPEVIAKTNAWLAHHGVTVDGLFPYMRDARDFQCMVRYAYDTLTVEGARYPSSGYHSTNAIFREILSRFAELKQVEYKSEPQLLHFLAPGLDQIWETQYLPHLERLYTQLGGTSLGSVGRHTLVPTPGTPLPRPVNDGQMGAIEQPKVDQRPATPAAKSAADEGIGLEDTQNPHTTVDATSSALDGMMSARGMAAISTLGTMGITPR